MEALANVRKHAHGRSEVRVRVDRSGDRLTVRVGDGGRPRHVSHGGFGLKGLAERVGLIGQASRRPGDERRLGPTGRALPQSSRSAVRRASTASLRATFAARVSRRLSSRRKSWTIPATRTEVTSTPASRSLFA